MEWTELLAAAREYGTPSFVLDIEAFKARLQAVREVFGERIGLCYAVKANPFLIGAAAEVVQKLEVCSPGELDICKALGIDPAQIVFSGVNKTRESVRDAVEYGVGVLTAESLRHAALIEAEGARRGQALDVLVRLNAGSQFGMSRADLHALVDSRKDYPHLNIVGIHYFVGTQRTKLKHQRKELGMLREMCEDLERVHGFRVQRLEYGPGLGVPMFADEDFSDTLAPAKELRDDLAALSEEVEVTVEMGRFFAAECGVYLTSVNDLKTNEATSYCIVDGGINHLTYYGQMMGMKVPVICNLDARAREAARTGGTDVEGGAVGTPVEDVSGSAGGASGEDGPWCICGSLCTTGDVLVRSADVPDVRLGDVLAFYHCGAYSVTEGLYLLLSRPMPRIIVRKAEGSLSLARNGLETSLFNTIDRDQED